MPKILYILLLVNLLSACQGSANQDHQQEIGAHQQRPDPDPAIGSSGKELALSDSSGKSALQASDEGSSTDKSQQTPGAAGTELSDQIPSSTVKTPAQGKIPPKDPGTSPDQTNDNKPITASGADVPQTAEPANSSPGKGAEKPSTTIPKTVGEQSSAPIFTPWDALFMDLNQFFKDCVSKGLVRYGQLAVSPVTLNEMMQKVANADLEKASEAQRKAFQINAYNLFVIKQIVEHYPISSPMDIAGFFDSREFDLAGKSTTLNDLEAGLRSDPRIHFALVCAAIGCPKIQSGAFMPATLDAQLDSRTRAAMNDPYFIRFKEGDQRAEVSQIFNWYAIDFGGPESVLEYINQFRTLPIPPATPIDFYEYDWKLNKSS